MTWRLAGLSMAALPNAKYQRYAALTRFCAAIKLPNTNNSCDMVLAQFGFLGIFHQC